MKEKNVGWVEQSETQQNQGFFVLGFVLQTPLASSREIRHQFFQQWEPPQRPSQTILSNIKSIKLVRSNGFSPDYTPLIIDAYLGVAE